MPVGEVIDGWLVRSMGGGNVETVLPLLVGSAACAINTEPKIGAKNTEDSKIAAIILVAKRNQVVFRLY